MSREDEIRYTDKYGEERVIHRTKMGLRHKRTDPSPVIALNREIGRLVGQRIRAERLHRGWSLQELASRAGLRSQTPKEYMWAIENPTRQEGIRLGTLYAMAMALEIEVSQLLPDVSEVQHIAGPREVTERVVALSESAA